MYYLLGSEDGSTRKATIKTAMKWAAVRALVVEYNLWHKAEWQALPDDFFMISEGSSDSDGGNMLQDLDKEDCPRGDPNVEPASDDDASDSIGASPMDSFNDILAAAEAICKQEGH